MVPNSSTHEPPSCLFLSFNKNFNIEGPFMVNGNEIGLKFALQCQARTKIMTKKILLAKKQYLKTLSSFLLHLRYFQSPEVLKILIDDLTLSLYLLVQDSLHTLINNTYHNFIYYIRQKIEKKVNKVLFKRSLL